MSSSGLMAKDLRHENVISVPLELNFQKYAVYQCKFKLRIFAIFDKK